MKTLIMLVSFLACQTLSALAHGDPFGGQPSPWVAKVQGEKPYKLEILYGESGTPLPTHRVVDGNVVRSDGQKEPHVSAYPVITDDFLKSAKRTSIRVSPVDTGMTSREDGMEVAYVITANKEGFPVKFWMRFRTQVAGFRNWNNP